MSLFLHVSGRQLELRNREYVIGRAPECDIVVDDREASRRHARLTCSPMTCAVEDLGSVNGTFVNGTPLTGRRLLTPGDVIIVARTELELRAAVPARPSRHRAVTVNDLRAVHPAQAAPTDASTTGQKDVVDLLAGVAQRAIDNGNPAQAEKVLGPVLSQTLDAIRKGSPPPPDLVATACRHALTLADATGKAQWLHYVIETYWLTGTPIPSPIVSRLATMWRGFQGHDVELLRAYVDRLRAGSQPMSGKVADAIARLDDLCQRP